MLEPKMSKAATRDLIVMRHAKSDWYAGVEGDFDRPLNRRGIKDAPRMGQWLKAEGYRPDRIISSPAMRARLTAQAVAKQIGVRERDIHWDERVYMADVSDLLRVLAGCPATARQVLLVGHNPGLEQLVAYLARPETLPRPPHSFLKTATVAHLRPAVGWNHLEAGNAPLLRLVTPKGLQG
jgi:phosphohistidine phosphatase